MSAKNKEWRPGGMNRWSGSLTTNADVRGRRKAGSRSKIRKRQQLHALLIVACEPQRHDCGYTDAFRWPSRFFQSAGRNLRFWKSQDAIVFCTWRSI